MGKTIHIRVDESLQQCLERIRAQFTVDLKKRYGLDEITINGPVASRILAAKMNGERSINYRIKKVGINKGILELL